VRAETWKDLEAALEEEFTQKASACMTSSEEGQTEERNPTANIVAK